MTPRVLVASALLAAAALVATAAAASGPQGHHLDVDVTGVLRTSTSGQIDLDGRSFSLCTWARRSAVNGDIDTMFGFGSRVGDNGLYFGWWTGGGLVFGTWSRHRYFESSGVDADSLDTWNHYCAVYEKDVAIKAYRNGVALALSTGGWVATVPFTGSTAGGGHLYLGGCAGGECTSFASDDTTLRGKMDNTRVYRRALSAAQVAALYRGEAVDATDLVLHLDYEGASGLTVPDLSGAGNEMQLIGAATFGCEASGGVPALGPGETHTTATSPECFLGSQTWRCGNDGTLALVESTCASGGSYDVSAHGVLVQDDSLTVDLSADFTLCSWVRRAAVTADIDTIVGMGTPSGNNGLFFGSWNGGELVLGLWSAYKYYGTMPAADLDTWTHYCATFEHNGAGARVFRNGVEVASTTDAWPASTPFGGTALGTGKVYVGGCPGGLCTSYAGDDTAMRGALDEVRVYERALTPAEVAALATAGTEPGAAGLVVHLTFDGDDGAGAADSSPAGNDFGTVSGLPAFGCAAASGVPALAEGETADVECTGPHGAGRRGVVCRNGAAETTYDECTQCALDVSSAGVMQTAALALDLDDTSFTICNWFMKRGAQSTATTMAGFGSRSTGRGLIYGSWGSTSQFMISVWNRFLTKAGVTGMSDTDVWHHVCAVVDVGVSASVYIDGALETGFTNNAWSSFNAFQGSADTTGRFYVGGCAGGVCIEEQNFDGLLARLRVFSRALSAGEVSELYTAGEVSDSTGLELSVDFRDPAGSTVAADASGNGRDLGFRASPYGALSCPALCEASQTVTLGAASITGAGELEATWAVPQRATSVSFRFVGPEPADTACDEADETDDARWTHAAGVGECDSTHTLRMPLTEVLASCNFAGPQDGGSTWYYEAVVEATTEEPNGTVFGEDTTRTVTTSFRVRVELPKSVDVSASAVAYGDVIQFALLSQQEVDTSTPTAAFKWTLVTSVQYPYELTAKEVTEESGHVFESLGLSLSAASVACPASGACTQTFEIAATESTSCELTDAELKSVFTIGCRSQFSGACDTPEGVETDTATFTVSTDSFCARVVEVATVTPTLTTSTSQGGASAADFVLQTTLFGRVTFAIEAGLSVTGTRLLSLDLVSEETVQPVTGAGVQDSAVVSAIAFVESDQGGTAPHLDFQFQLNTDSVKFAVGGGQASLTITAVVEVTYDGAGSQRFEVSTEAVSGPGSMSTAASSTVAVSTPAAPGSASTAGSTVLGVSTGTAMVAGVGLVAVVALAAGAAVGARKRRSSSASPRAAKTVQQSSSSTQLVGAPAAAGAPGQVSLSVLNDLGAVQQAYDASTA